MGEDKFVGAGGTPGGVGQFFIGLIMFCVGAYLLLNQVEVTTSWWHFWGTNGFGLSLLPMLIGVGILFFNGKSAGGWILTAIGFAIILAGILMNMDIYFRRTSLYNTLVMLVLIAGGLGLIARSLRPATSKKPEA
jgi:predicted membrane channel-forming protein YqfA (hemolysin III family)